MVDYTQSVAEKWWGSHGEYRQSSTDRFMSSLPSDLSGMRILDLGCGPGEEMFEYRKRNARTVIGIDSSPDMVRIALHKSKADIVVQTSMDSPELSFGSLKFDWIVSKWAMQAVEDYDMVLKNINNLLNPQGSLLLLLVHPVRQFLEKKRVGKDYFKQEVVDSILFNGAATVREPSHTIMDLLSPYFFSRFDLQELHEGFAEGCDIVNGDHYPSYLLVRAQKRS